MQTDPTEHRQQAAQATALCVDCAHQVDLGNVGLPRICVLPANTGIDLVAGGPAWLPCTLARADDNVYCGPQGLGFTPRTKRPQQKARKPRSWWQSIRNVLFPFTRAVQSVDLANDAGVQVVKPPIHFQPLAIARLAVKRDAGRLSKVGMRNLLLVHHACVAHRAKELHCAREA